MFLDKIYIVKRENRDICSNAGHLLVTRQPLHSVLERQLSAQAPERAADVIVESVKLLQSAAPAPAAAAAAVEASLANSTRLEKKSLTWAVPLPEHFHHPVPLFVEVAED